MVRAGTWGRPKGVGVGVRRSAVIQLRPLHAPVSVSVQECQEQQNQGWSTVRQLLVEAKHDISMVGRNAQFASEKVKTLPAGAFADLRWVGICLMLGAGNWGRGL